MVPEALKAAERLAGSGISVEVIDPRTLAPLDIDTIVSSVEKTGRLVVAHLAHKIGGVGAEIAQAVTERAFHYLDAPVMRVAALDAPVPASQPLEAAVFPGTDEIVAACRNAGIKDTHEHELSAERQLDLLRRMWLIRFFEEQAIRLYGEGHYRGSTHPYIAQEATALGVCAALKPNDLVLATYRGHGASIAKGRPTRMMAELLGKATGMCKGKGGSMHLPRSTWDSWAATPSSPPTFRSPAAWHWPSSWTARAW